jgi:hypothetical protein
LASPDGPFLTRVCISTVAFYYQSASFYIRFYKGVVCFAKMAELEQQKQLGKENDKLRFLA